MQRQRQWMSPSLAVNCLRLFRSKSVRIHNNCGNHRNFVHASWNLHISSHCFINWSHIYFLCSYCHGVKICFFTWSSRLSNYQHSHINRSMQFLSWVRYRLFPQGWNILHWCMDRADNFPNFKQHCVLSHHI